MATVRKYQIKMRRGTAANRPTLAVGEQWLDTDTGRVWVGTSAGNVQLGEVPTGTKLYSIGYAFPTEGMNSRQINTYVTPNIQVWTYPMRSPFAITPVTAKMQVTNNVADSYAAIGIYDSTKALLWQSGLINTATAGVVSANVTGVSFAPDTLYYIAYATANKNQSFGAVQMAFASTAALLHYATGQFGVSQYYSDGNLTLPAALGTITAHTAIKALPIILFES